MTLRRFAPVLALLALPALASQAAADCEPAGPLDEEIPVASVAFVGTVTATRGAVAQFAVSEVWAGEVGPAVEIRGISDNVPGGIGEDDRTWVVGDAYLVVGGIPEAHGDPVYAMAQMAIDMRETIAEVSRKSGQPLDVRIGMAVGPVVAGVIGRRRFAYDLWGDTVNTAARMESHGAPGEIHVTRAVSDKLRGRMACESRGVQHIKGKGDMETFFLKA